VRSRRVGNYYSGTRWTSGSLRQKSHHLELARFNTALFIHSAITHDWLPFTMRRLLRIYEPVIESTIGRIAGQHQSSYICRRCRRRNAASQLSTPTSQFSTSVQRTSEIKDVLGRYAGAFKGETSVFDNQDTQKKEEPYTPATTWEGLEWVGTKQWYEDRKRPQKAFTAYVDSRYISGLC
jgi:hypothetical protein